MNSRYLENWIYTGFWDHILHPNFALGVSPTLLKPQDGEHLPYSNIKIIKVIHECLSLYRILWKKIPLIDFANISTQPNETLHFDTLSSLVLKI